MTPFAHALVRIAGLLADLANEAHALPEGLRRSPRPCGGPALLADLGSRPKAFGAGNGLQHRRACGRSGESEIGPGNWPCSRRTR